MEFRWKCSRANPTKRNENKQKRNETKKKTKFRDTEEEEPGRPWHVDFGVPINEDDIDEAQSTVGPGRRHTHPGPCSAASPAAS